MALSYTPKSVGTDGNLRVHFVADADDPTSAADVTGGIDVTYYLKTFTFSSTETNIEDPRLTLATTLSKPGPRSYTFELQYVFGDDTDNVAQETFVPGVQGSFVIRYAHANEDAFTAGDIVSIVPVEAGSQRVDTPAANSQFTITQAFGVTGVPQEFFTLLA